MSVTSESSNRLTDAQVGEVLALAKDADSVELKLTVPDSYRRQAAAALGVDPLDAVRVLGQGEHLADLGIGESVR